jgi:hypothetical protein
MVLALLATTSDETSCMAAARKSPEHKDSRMLCERRIDEPSSEQSEPW